MSSSSVSKRLHSVSILAVVLAMQHPFIHSVMSLNTTNAYLHHICITSEGVSKSKGYEKQVKALIDLLSPSLDYGYINGGRGGETSEDIYAKIQCRGDVSKSTCQSCLSTAFSEIRRKCPNYRGRIIWYDNCLLDLSSHYTYDNLDFKHYFYLHNANEVVGDTQLFNKFTKAVLYKLKERASRKGQKPYTNDHMYAAGEERLGGEKLYAMVQCSQDLTERNCSVCLDWITAKLPECCNGRQGGRVLTPSCYFRYEIYPFVKT